MSYTPELNGVNEFKVAFSKDEQTGDADYQFIDDSEVDDGDIQT